MSNTTRWIPAKVKAELIDRIKKMPDYRNKHILEDVFIGEMSCKAVADSMKYFSNRGTPISVRMVQTIVTDFYPDYWNDRKGKGRPMSEERKRMKDLKFEIIAERGCKCEKCGAVKYLELHHITPIAFGGTNDRYNVLLLCESCHKKETSVQKWGEHHKGWQNRRLENVD